VRGFSSKRLAKGAAEQFRRLWMRPSKKVFFGGKRLKLAQQGEPPILIEKEVVFN
jgi:hypothetical protein